MLHRSSSSRKRRASRSAASSPQGRPRVPALTLEDATPAYTSPSGRRASVAVTPNSESNQLLRSPRRSPRHSLAPDLDISPSTPENDTLKSIHIANFDRSPRHSLAPDMPNFNKSPRNSLVPDYNRSPRNSLVPESMNRNARNSLIPDSAMSPRNSLIPNMDRSPRHSLVPDAVHGSRLSLNPLDFNRSPRNSLVPDPGARSPRHSLVPESASWNQARNASGDGSRSPRHSLTPLQMDIGRSPRGSVVADTALSGRATSPRGSIAEIRTPRGNSPRGSIGGSSMTGEGRGARGSLTLTFQEPLDKRRASDDNGMGGSRGRSSSPYRGSTAGRGPQINHAFASSEAGSRRASSSVSQVSGDEQRRLCEQGGGGGSSGGGSGSGAQGLGLGLAALTTYGSVAYQLKDANMEASGTCDFLCRAITIVNRTVVVTVMLGCLSTLPIVMLIMGVQFLKDCPREPHIPVYMVVGGALGGIKLGSLLWGQLAGTPRSPPSMGPRLASAVLTLMLLIWFALGNYWILHIKWPDFKPALFEPNKWCDKTLYTFALVHLVIVYSVLAIVVLVIFVLATCQLFGCPWLGPSRYK